MIFRYPTNYVAITTFYEKGKHWGLDLGFRKWNDKEFGQNMPIYAAADGVVYSTHDKDRTGKSWGNYIKIKHDDNTYTLYGHLLEGSLKVKKGDKVKMGQQIAKMGKSGIATGCHCHYEIYIGGANTKYRVDPLPLTYVFPDQVVCNSDKDIVKYYTPMTKPVERNTKVDQLEVIKNKLRIRTEPSLKGEILGFAEKGYYNDLETKVADGYTWHKVDEYNWLADVDDYVELLPKVEFNVGDKVTFKELPDYFIISEVSDNSISVTTTTNSDNLNKID